MHIKFFILLFLFKVMLGLTMAECPQKLQNITTTNCVSGRRFYARFDSIPRLKKLFSKHVLNQLYAFPWTAQIVILYKGSSSICTGTLINDRYIITAQQCCLPPLKPQHLTVKLGYGDFESEKLKFTCTVRSPVVAIILDPNYQHFENEIALLKIQPVIYTKTIYPIQLPNFIEKYKEIPNLVTEMAGYISHNSNTFEHHPLKILNNKECRSTGISHKIVNSDLLCGILTDPSTTPCSVSAGTPIIVEQPTIMYTVSTLLGVITENNKECRPNQDLILNVKIANRLTWILSNTRDAEYCKE